VRPNVKTICVEFAQPAPWEPVRDVLARMNQAGYDVVAALFQPSGWNLTLVGRADG